MAWSEAHRGLTGSSCGAAGGRAVGPGEQDGAPARWRGAGEGARPGPGRYTGRGPQSEGASERRGAGQKWGLGGRRPVTRAARGRPAPGGARRAGARGASSAGALPMGRGPTARARERGGQVTSAGGRRAALARWGKPLARGVAAARQGGALAATAAAAAAAAVGPQQQRAPGERGARRGRPPASARRARGGAGRERGCGGQHDPGPEGGRQKDVDSESMRAGPSGSWLPQPWLRAHWCSASRIHWWRQLRLASCSDICRGGGEGMGWGGASARFKGGCLRAPAAQAATAPCAAPAARVRAQHSRVRPHPLPPAPHPAALALRVLWPRGQLLADAHHKHVRDAAALVRAVDARLLVALEVEHADLGLLRGLRWEVSTRRGGVEVGGQRGQQECGRRRGSGRLAGGSGAREHSAAQRAAPAASAAPPRGAPRCSRARQPPPRSRAAPRPRPSRHPPSRPDEGAIRAAARGAREPAAGQSPAPRAAPQPARARPRPAAPPLAPRRARTLGNTHPLPPLLVISSTSTSSPPAPAPLLKRKGMHLGGDGGGGRGAFERGGAPSGRLARGACWLRASRTGGGRPRDRPPRCARAPLPLRARPRAAHPATSRAPVSV
jgi:hypothetical protein